MQTLCTRDRQNTDGKRGGGGESKSEDGSEVRRTGNGHICPLKSFLLGCHTMQKRSMQHLLLLKANIRLTNDTLQQTRRGSGFLDSPRARPVHVAADPRRGGEKRRGEKREEWRSGYVTQ